MVYILLTFITILAMNAAGIKKFYLFGQNIDTSLSPLIHNLLFTAKDKNHFQYLPTPNSTPPDLSKMQEDK